MFLSAAARAGRIFGVDLTNEIDDFSGQIKSFIDAMDEDQLDGLAGKEIQNSNSAPANLNIGKKPRNPSLPSINNNAAKSTNNNNNADENLSNEPNAEELEENENSSAAVDSSASAQFPQRLEGDALEILRSILSPPSESNATSAQSALHIIGGLYRVAARNSSAPIGREGEIFWLCHDHKLLLDEWNNGNLAPNQFIQRGKAIELEQKQKVEESEAKFDKTKLAHSIVENTIEQLDEIEKEKNNANSNKKYNKNNNSASSSSSLSCFPFLRSKGRVQPEE